MELKEIINEIECLNCKEQRQLIEHFKEEIEEVFMETQEICPVHIDYLGDEYEIKDAVEKKCKELKLI